ncbi:MAG: prolipoprotein diacylglyceryl transferase [Anaerolineae bacterium]|nr:prolipoprotein diacylglyceryl transferase [Anaerolineae bacterium]
MWPILARYGSFFLYSYTVVLGVGVAAALAVAYCQLRPQPSRWTSFLDGALVGLGAGILAGRLLYVAANWPYFQTNPTQIIQIGQGGLGYHGAAAAGLLAFTLWQRWRGLPPAPQLDALALPFALLTAFGWLACYLDGCAYGRETELGLLAGNLPDSYGVWLVRYQTQLLGLGGALLTVGAGWVGQKRGGRPGTLFWFVLACLSGQRLLLTFWRGDPVPTLNHLRLDTLADGVLLVICLGVLGWIAGKER